MRTPDHQPCVLVPPNTTVSLSNELSMTFYATVAANSVFLPVGHICRSCSGGDRRYYRLSKVLEEHVADDRSEHIVLTAWSASHPRGTGQQADPSLAEDAGKDENGKGRVCHKTIHWRASHRVRYGFPPRCHRGQCPCSVWWIPSLRHMAPTSCIPSA